MARAQRLEADLEEAHSEARSALQGRERAEAQALELTTMVSATESAGEQALHDMQRLQSDLEEAQFESQAS